MNSDINLETGLLSVIRKIICLLPDGRVKQVLGPILDQENIVVMTNNSSVLVRTAVVRVNVIDKQLLINGIWTSLLSVLFN